MLLQLVQDPEANPAPHTKGQPRLGALSYPQVGLAIDLLLELLGGDFIDVTAAPQIQPLLPS